MESNHLAWNDRQKALRTALTRHPVADTYLPLFEEQHAWVHPRVQAIPDYPTFEENLWYGLSDAQVRSIPPQGEHAIAWCIWHITRIEDAVMHFLIANEEQLLDSGGWYDRPGFHFRSTGNEQTADEISKMCAEIDLDVLRAYRLAVSRDTLRIVRQLSAADLNRRASPDSVDRLFASGTLDRRCPGLAEYWAGLTFDGLLLMPPTRHPLLHLNECERIKHKLQRLCA